MKEFSVDVKTGAGREGDIVVLKTHGSINSSTTPALDSEFENLLGQNHRMLVIDLSDTDFVSSSGIGVLLSVVNTLRERGGDLILMNSTRLIDDILDIMNISDYFRSIKSLDELTISG